MQELHILLVTDRPAVETFFHAVRRCGVSPIALSRVPLAASAPPGHPPAPAVAVVDVAPDPAEALRVCEGLCRQQPSLPILGLLCCRHAVTPWHLRALVEAGVAGLLDLGSTADETLRLLRSVRRGDVVLSVQLGREHAAMPWLGGAPEGRRLARGSRPMHPLTAANTRLLTLVARGLSDAEIGQQLHLSPHTIKHQIERLRADLGMHNRLELAAWAGWQGFYPSKPQLADAAAHEAPPPSDAAP